MIVVTGATGNVGRPLIEYLVGEGAQVRAVSRTPETADLGPAVEVCASVQEALPGASAVFVNSRALGAQMADVIAMAVRQGVAKLVALSAINADDDVDRQPSRIRGDRNREADELVVASGSAWVSLRPSVFATNFAGMWGGQLKAGDVVAGPYADASLAPIVEADIAAVAARALLSDDLDGQRIPLTGPEALTNSELAAAVGRSLGRPIRYVEVDPQVVRERFGDIGFPATFADAYLAMLAQAVGRPALVTGEVEKILGRPAQSFAAWAATHTELFTS